MSTRSQFNINKLKATLQYMKEMGAKNTEADFKILMGPKYEEFMQLHEKKPSMLEHLMGCFLDV